jgi:hypothetical protein
LKWEPKKEMSAYERSKSVRIKHLLITLILGLALLVPTNQAATDFESPAYSQPEWQESTISNPQQVLNVHQGVPQSAVPDAIADIPGATEDWLAAVQEQIHRDMHSLSGDGGASYPLTVDSLASTPSWYASGETTGDAFGFAVGTAGDVNGDGYADVIVGADGHNIGTGRAYVYQGGESGLSATPATTLSGETTSNLFGHAVGTAGDVNGDGYADVIVGARGHNASTGRAYVYYGGESGLSVTPATTLSGETTSSHFGCAVGTAGDVNGDGYADVIVGASRHNSYTGRAYVYHGGEGGLSATPATTLSGETIGNRFGGAVGTAGDVNGDGYADVIVGAPYHDSGTGRAYVYHGEESGLSASPATTLSGETTDNAFGFAVGTAGDVNGDGYADVIVGAPYHNSATGRAYIYHGRESGLSASPATTLSGETISDLFGWAVGMAGDVNGDGYVDVIVGAEGYNSYAGRAYVYHGGESGLSATPAPLSGEAAQKAFGHAVGTAGDVNGGYADVIVGAPGHNSWTGRAYAYYGGRGYEIYLPLVSRNG